MRPIFACTRRFRQDGITTMILMGRLRPSEKNAHFFRRNFNSHLQRMAGQLIKKNNKYSRLIFNQKLTFRK